MQDIKHLHFESIESTQDYIQEHHGNELGHILISCDHQTKGRGQYGRVWDDSASSLCFSASLSAQKIVSLSALEIPLIIRNYFLNKYQIELTLKWPNDIMRENKKCGGIIISNNGNGQILFGLGLNINFNKLGSYRTPATSIFEKEFSFSTRDLALDLYHFIIKNRVIPEEITSLWNKSCSHLNQDITLEDAQTKISGKFLGVGNCGQAQIETPLEIKEIYSGTVYKS